MTQVLARRRLPRIPDRFAALGAAVVVLLVLAAVLAPWLAPYDADPRPLESQLPPSGAHWFGTDNAGRDVLSQILYGARTSLFIAVAVLAVSATVGVTLGMVAGYAGGWARDVIMRITDVFLAFPALLLSLALAVVLPPSVNTVVLAIAVTWWPWYARLAASTAASIATRGYVDAARCLGVPAPLIVLRHVLPNALTPVLVQMSLDAGGVILTSAALSYLGLGAQEPTAEWGLMVQQGQTYFTTSWWMVTFPGLAILVTAFAFNVLGEGLRNALDPRRVVK
ncbi:putative D,D-dipeptide transport system permease protein DdpC [Nonomuraea coxensis DSM 45129]|uniref:D,D-dipeptide transport system permease protein DdpC n=1 Tax=Nonomuraea coxensis DSM 45129 TaxID=1122611 RepID=A0ABX8U983_9ACTN|nr:ABC transporter permease [Nonomuraea coxensis]QYC44314.1 putative D,D-dipeptide transport system permease protein DdpC [Nonomuraea coxensis DSM 45129]